jgi:hypothetical protein
MQTPFSPQSTPFPELFTRERRRTRMRQFLETFDQQRWKKFSPVSDLLPIKAGSSQSTAEHWTEKAAS